MSYSVSKTTITLTRGDTFKATITIYDSDGVTYTPAEGDKVRFAMKKTYSEKEPLIVKDIPIDSMMLILKPSDTKDLEFGKYVYDIELTTAEGVVDTFIQKAILILTEEVH